MTHVPLARMRTTLPTGDVVHPASAPIERTAARAAAPASVASDGASDAGTSRRDFVASIRLAVEILSRNDYPTTRMTAEFVGMSVRTLQRRLAQAGVSHQGLVAQVRFATAAAVLERTDAKILQLALDLGYSDHANFTRAFRRWAGCAPREYRVRGVRRRRVAKSFVSEARQPTDDVSA